MLDQNNPFRETALGSFHDLFLAITANPAMLVFFNGTSNNKWGKRELRTRDDGALLTWCRPWRLHPRRRPGDGARAYGMARRMVLQNCTTMTFASIPNTTTQNPRRSSTRRELELGRRSRPVRRTIQCTPSFFVTKLWGYFIPTEPDKQTLPSLEALYTSPQFGIRPIAGGDPPAPRLLQWSRTRDPARRIQRWPDARHRTLH